MPTGRFIASRCLPHSATRLFLASHHHHLRKSRHQGAKRPALTEGKRRPRTVTSRSQSLDSWLCQGATGLQTPSLRCEGAQPSAARFGALPSRLSSNRATAGMLGVCSVNSQNCDQTVATTSSTVGAHRIHTIQGAGSSMLFGRTSAPRPIGVLDHNDLHRPKVGLMAGSGASQNGEQARALRRRRSRAARYPPA